MEEINTKAMPTAQRRHAMVEVCGGYLGTHGMTISTSGPRTGLGKLSRGRDT